MKTKFIKRQDAEVFSHKAGEKFRIACCDCGLVHDIAADVEGGDITIVASRNARSTASLRRRADLPLLDEPRQRLQAIYAWIDSNRYVGRSVNATDEQLLRDEIAQELAIEIRDAV